MILKKNTTIDGLIGLIIGLLLLIPFYLIKSNCWGMGCVVAVFPIFPGYLLSLLFNPFFKILDAFGIHLPFEGILLFLNIIALVLLFIVLGKLRRLIIRKMIHRKKE